MFNRQTFLPRRAEDGQNIGRKTQGYHQAPLTDPNEILLEASTYLYEFHQEHGTSHAMRNEIEEELEQQVGRTVPAHWAWIGPPISGSATPVFHIPHY